MMRFTAYCYGRQLDIEETELPSIKDLMEKHIREECDGGAAPWATDIHWHEGRAPEGHRFWAAASGGHLAGSWLNHQIEETRNGG